MICALCKYVSILFIIGLLSACGPTRYQSANQMVASETAGRLVTYNIEKAFYHAAPDCVVVLPVIGPVKLAHKLLIERAAARHLRGKITRVIGPTERVKLERQLAIDFANKLDRQFLSSYWLQSRPCRYFAEIKVIAIEENFVVVWAGRKVHLGIEITNGRSGDSLWKAEHSSTRNDGGLPLSPLSLGSSAWRAGQFSADDDMFPSMIDDVFRRILVALPDMRSL